MINETDKSKKIASFVNSLDKESKVILFYCWRNDYATIRELSHLIASKNDLYTLFKIKEVINAEASKVLGKSALIFKERAIDPITKQIINFTWWSNLEMTPQKKDYRIRIRA